MQLPWKKRSDLITTPHDSGGWVVKDPLTLHYTLLDEVEYRVLNLMDGRLSFAALLKAVQGLRPERSFTADDVAAFIGLLAGHQLIRRTVPGDSLRLNPEYSTTGWRRFFGPMFALLRLQLPLVNPSRFLDRLLPWCSWLYSRAAVSVFSTIGIVACLIVLTRFHELRRSLPSMDEFLGASNLLLMFGVFAFVKTLHELGHALTARHFGAECNECGLMLLVFTPVLYTNVSDAWLLPRRQRLLVTAGGILVELSIAATATILWWFATPGLTKSLLLNIMLICSVNTVIFNGNPLLRFDGYFLLADATRLPNLASRASIVVQELIVRILTGRQMNDAEESESRRFLLGYGISSMVYRLFLTLAILQLVQQVTARWHVQFVGTFMSAIMLIGFLVIPLIRFGNQLANSMFTELPEGSALAGFSWFRPAVCTVIAGAVCLFPFPQSVVAPAYVQPAGVPVYASLSGQFTPHAKYGDSVQKDDVLGELRNRDLEQKRLRLAARLGELKLKIDSLENNPATATSATLPTLHQAVTSAAEQLQDFDAELAGLIVRSPERGVFLPPVLTVRPANPDLPERWHGVPAAFINSGAWIDRGVLMGHVGDPAAVTLAVCVEESQIELIQSGNAAVFLFSGETRTYDGVVMDVSHLATADLPLAFATAGLVSGRPTETGFRPSTVSYLATVRLNRVSEPAPAIYGTGMVRISARPTSLLSRVLRYLRRTFG